MKDPYVMGFDIVNKPAQVAGIYIPEGISPEDYIRKIINATLAAGDAAEAGRLPVGAQVRETVTTLPEFRAAYTSPTWSETKHKAMDLRTRHLRPAYEVISHKEGWMTVKRGKATFEVIPRFWEPCTEELRL
jgi:hypothetical protein